MADVTDTLFYPFTQGMLRIADGPVLFLNARNHGFVETFKDAVLQQSFKSFAQTLEEAGHKTFPVFEGQGHFMTALVLLPKNSTEADYTVAAALQSLAPGGLLVCAAGNKAGGTRLRKIFQAFGVSGHGEASKNHARVAWGTKNEINTGMVDKALAAGRLQKAGDFFSRPGLFSWDRVDVGSEILARHLPEGLAGLGGDFGCGYGYLARRVLQKNAGIKTLFCLDVDWRAVEACRKNLEGYSNVDYQWVDLTKSAAMICALDFVVMNPPFHEEKITDSGIGCTFVKTAAASLRGGGRLWMVANARLPYEDALRTHFTGATKIFEGSGYKIYCGVK